MLSIGGLGYPDLGRGGAERSECPPVCPRVAGPFSSPCGTSSSICDAELHLRNVAALRSLAVVNALGQAVLTRTHDGAETVVVPTGTLPAGLYLLRLTDTEGGVHTLRFAKR